jgi:hypothetical protein
MICFGELIFDYQSATAPDLACDDVASKVSHGQFSSNQLEVTNAKFVR